jgi:hypothetical protein
MVYFWLSFHSKNWADTYLFLSSSNRNRGKAFAALLEKK